MKEVNGGGLIAEMFFASATAQGAALGWETLALLRVGDRNESKWWEALGFPPFVLIEST